MGVRAFVKMGAAGQQLASNWLFMFEKRSCRSFRDKVKTVKRYRECRDSCKIVVHVSSRLVQQHQSVFYLWITDRRARLWTTSSFLTVKLRSTTRVPVSIRILWFFSNGWIPRCSTKIAGLNNLFLSSMPFSLILNCITNSTLKVKWISSWRESEYKRMQLSSLFKFDIEVIT